ncbi:MAG: hypothetical protein AABY13_04920 [Nanoarchaeota archaeon]
MAFAASKSRRGDVDVSFNQVMWLVLVAALVIVFFAIIYKSLKVTG